MLKKYAALFLALAILVLGSVGALAEETSVGVTGAKAEASKQYGDLTLSAEAVASDNNVEAYAHLGAYTTKDRDGKTVNGTGLSIGADAESTGAGTSASARYGSDDNNAKVSVEASVLSEKAEISLDAGMQNGKLSVQAGASAELIGAQAGASASGTVAGVETKASASVNVGIGASASGGIKEGKLSVNVGVSIGIGAKVKVEVDVGTAAKKVSKAASSAWRKIKRWF